VAENAARRQLTERTVPEKVVDDTVVLKRPRRGAKLRQEVWQTADGKVSKYNLAYINHQVCRVDNGRVLGYDNSHDGHHRHFMGNVAPVEFIDYQSLAERFQEEVRELWTQEDGRQEEWESGK
jgi:hypothetical protein